MTQETNDVRERMQEVARTISIMLPPGTGFVLLAFDLERSDGRMEYIANAGREGVIKAMLEFIEKTDGGRWAKHA